MALSKVRLSRPEFLPQSLVRAAWKHKFLVAITAAVVAAGGIAVVYRLPAVYKAEALILVDPQKIPERFVASTVNLDAQDRLATLSQEIMSSTRLQSIIDEFGLYVAERKIHTPEEVVDMMRKKIEVNLEKGVGGSRPGAFRVTFEGSNPILVAKVVNRITDLYIQENLRSREVRATGTSDFIDNELRAAKQRLEQQEAALSRYKIEHNGELPEQQNSLIAVSTQLQIELQGNQDAIRRAQQEKVMLDNALAAAESAEAALRPRPAAPSKGVTTAEDENDIPLPVSHYRREYDEVQSQLSAALERYSDSHPEVIRLRLKQKTLEKLLREDENRIQRAAQQNATRPQISPSEPPAEAAVDPLALERTRAHERTRTLRAQIASTQHELETRTAERDRILKDLASYQRRIEQLPLREQQMASLTRDYEFSRNYYSSLFAKRTDAEMATDLERRQKAETFQILDAARPPSKPFKPNRTLLAAVSCIFGLALGLASAIAFEFRKGVLLGEWELPAGVVVLGRVPHIHPDTFWLEHSDQPKSGTREVGGRYSFALLSSATVVLLALVAAAYLFVRNRI